MKKRFLSTLLSLVLVVALVTPVWSSTLNALPQWPDEAVYAVFNLDKPHEVAKRVANSFLFKTLALLEPDLEMASDWLKQFPVVSASVAVGMGEEGFSLQGAIKFADGKKEILERMGRGEGQEGDVDALLNSPVPGQLSLVPFEGPVYSVAAEGMSLVLASVEKDMLLLGFTPEDIAAARDALNDGGKRMKLNRSLPQGSFFYFHDNGMVATELQAESEGVLGEPVGNLVAEIGLDASDKRYDLSIFSNFAQVFSLVSDMPFEPLSMEDRILMGGGKPWLAFMGRFFLEKKHFESIKEAGGEEVVMALEAAKQFGLDEDGILRLLRAVGMVFGGEANLFGTPIPGGYIYLSGENKEIHLLLPIMELAAQESGLPFEAVSRSGWTALYAMQDPVDFVMGIKDGVLMAGALSLDALDIMPELSDRMEALYDESNLNGFFHFDAKVMRDYVLSALEPEGILAAFMADDEDVADTIPLFLEGLKALVEFRSLDITSSSMNRADITLVTEEADQKEIDAISALAEKWVEMGADGN